MMFNNMELTTETILKTRAHFAMIRVHCIYEVVIGDITVNDQDSYFKWMQDLAIADIAGEHDHTFTFLQRAYWLQTGQMIPLFSK